MSVTDQGGFDRQRVIGMLLGFGSNYAKHRYYRLPTLLKNSNKMVHGDGGRSSRDATIDHTIVLTFTWNTHQMVLKGNVEDALNNNIETMSKS